MGVSQSISVSEQVLGTRARIRKGSLTRDKLKDLCWFGLHCIDALLVRGALGLGNIDEQISSQKFSAHLLTVLPDPSPGRLPPPPLPRDRLRQVGAPSFPGLALGLVVAGMDINRCDVAICMVENPGDDFSRYTCLTHHQRGCRSSKVM